MRPSKAAVVLGLTASLAACARPGNTPAGTPTADSRTVTFWAGAAPVRPSGIAVAPSRLAVRPGPACAERLAGLPERAPTTPSPESEAAARARKALEAANPPVPRRGPLPNKAAAGAEGCVRALRLELNLLTAGRGGPPDETALRRSLLSMGLSGIRIGSGSDFAASTGDACVHGTFTADGPELSIGPTAADGTCHS